MRKKLLLTVLSLTMFSLHGQIFHESFDYTSPSLDDAPGNLGAGGNWADDSSSSSTNAEIVDPSPFVGADFSLPDQVGKAYSWRGGSEDPVRRFTAETSGTVYWSSFIKIDNWDSSHTPGTTGKQLMSLLKQAGDVGGGGSKSYLAALSVIKQEGEDKFRLGVANNHVSGDSHYSVNVTTKGDPHAVNMSQKLEIENATVYTLSFDAWTDATTANRNIKVGVGLSADPWTNNAVDVAITNTKATITQELAETNFAAADARVIFDLGAATGEVHIDNVKLVKGSETTNLVKNGDFRYGNDYWLVGVADNTIVPLDDAANYTSTKYDFGTKYFVVGSYDIASKDGKIWVTADKNIDANTPSATYNNGDDIDEINGFFIRADSNANTPPTTIDELRVGTTWASVVPSRATASVSENKVEGLSLYPNPTTGKIVISANSEIDRVEIFNMIGMKIVSINNLSNNLIDVSSLSRGVYLAKIISGNSVSTRKIVKH